ncbi:MAG: YhcB family protein [Colwellia sp.]|nr:YhcB family protein [Colwellia sp.]
MTVVIALIVFVVGAVVGFLANHFLSSSNQEQRKLAEQANKSEAALSQYKLDVADHLESSAKLLDKMNNTCQTAMKQMEESTQLLQRATTNETEGMPFFSSETQEQLAQTAGLRHPKRAVKEVESSTEAPLDYSGEASGLFVDQQPQDTSKVG